MRLTQLMVIPLVLAPATTCRLASGLPESIPNNCYSKARQKRTARPALLLQPPAARVCQRIGLICARTSLLAFARFLPGSGLEDYCCLSDKGRAGKSVVPDRVVVRCKWVAFAGDRGHDMDRMERCIDHLAVVLVAPGRDIGSCADSSLCITRRLFLS